MRIGWRDEIGYSWVDWLVIDADCCKKCCDIREQHPVQQYTGVCREFVSRRKLTRTERLVLPLARWLFDVFE